MSTTARVLVLSTPFLALGLRAPAAEDPPLEPGFVSLFDGKDFEKEFTIHGKKESWSVVDGVLRARSGGDRIMSRRKFSDFILRLDWKVTKNGNSGVFVRVPAAEDGAPWVSGFEVQISNEPRDDAHCTGSLYGVAAVKPRPDESHDVWHTYEITCLGGSITVVLDGVRCVAAAASDIPEMRSRPPAGHIGLQDFHAAGDGTIEYRNIRIQEIGPGGAIPGFRDLSADPKGWAKIQTGHGSGGRWELVDGAWIGEQDPPGSGNGGVLASVAELGDFELVIELQPDWGIDSGIFLRSTDRGACYQILVDYHGRGGNVGGIYGEGTGGFNFRNYSFREDKEIVPATFVPGLTPMPFPAEAWLTYWKLDAYNEIRARIRGNPPVIDVWVNREHLTHFVDTEKRLGDRGRLGLQVHGGKGSWPDGAKARYRRIQVRELAP